MVNLTTTENEECSICLTNIINIGKLNCDHKFCYDCINHWSATNGLCPLCRQLITHVNDVQLNKHNDFFITDDIVIMGNNISTDGSYMLSSNYITTSSNGNNLTIGNTLTITGDVTLNVSNIVNNSNIQTSSINLGSTGDHIYLDNNEMKIFANENHEHLVKQADADNNSDWFDIAPVTNIPYNNHLFFNTVGTGKSQSLIFKTNKENPIVPKFVVSPWIQSSIEPDENLKSLY